jgi:hypothetical protein
LARTHAERPSPHAAPAGWPGRSRAGGTAPVAGPGDPRRARHAARREQSSGARADRGARIGRAELTTTVRNLLPKPIRRPRRARLNGPAIAAIGGSGPHAPAPQGTSAAARQLRRAPRCGRDARRSSADDPDSFRDRQLSEPLTPARTTQPSPPVFRATTRSGVAHCALSARTSSRASERLARRPARSRSGRSAPVRRRPHLTSAFVCDRVRC